MGFVQGMADSGKRGWVSVKPIGSGYVIPPHVIGHSRACTAQAQKPAEIRGMSDCRYGTSTVRLLLKIDFCQELLGYMSPNKFHFKIRKTFGRKNIFVVTRFFFNEKICFEFSEKNENFKIFIEK